MICSYHLGYQNGEIYGDFLPGAQASIRILMAQHPVFVCTARDAQQVAGWLQSRGFVCTTTVPDSGFWNDLGLLLVTNIKLPASAYIDDRAVRFVNWSQALTDVSYALLTEARKPD